MTRGQRTGRLWAAPVALLASAVVLAGCLGAPTYRPVGFVTPKDPPPLPLRKPQPPADLAAWRDPAIVTSTGVSSAPLPEAVEVQELAPQTAPPQQAAVQPPATPPMVAAQPVDDAQPAAVAQPAAIAQPAGPAGGRYVVAKGDSLYGIARRFGLPVRAVIDANDLQPPYALSIGQSLSVPRAPVHEVVAGDTVYNISQRYDVDRSELVRLNDIQPPYTIPLGQKLLLPTPGSAVRAEPVVTDVAYTAADQQPAAAAAPPVGQTVPEAAAPQAVAPNGVPAETAPAVQPAAKSRDTVRAALAHPPARAGSSFLWPVQGPLLSSYGAKAGGEHNDGINIAAPRGTPVRAAEKGVVAYAGSELKGFGKLLLVKHADGWVTAYAHNEELLVGAGDTVQRGQAIAKVGSSGHVDRPQLHFEVRRGARAVNPEAQLSPRTAQAGN